VDLGLFLKSLDPLRDSVRAEMERVLNEHQVLLEAIGLYNFQGGGKLLRPLIYLLSLEGLGVPIAEPHFRHSLIFELIHMASLLHDDIVDQSSTRRGRKAAHLVFGVTETVLAGDFLAGTAANLAVKTGSLEFMGNLQENMLQLSLGEIAELQARWKPDMDEDEYFGIIRRKTASLFSAAAKGAAILANAGKAYEDLLYEFSLNFGLSFQIIDDILDYEADPAKLGKPILQDQLEGRVTLPFILARKALKGADLARMDALGEKIEKDPSDLQEILELVGQGSGLDKARAVAANFLALALAAIDKLPGGERLASLARGSLDRTS
jgi:octaprenyl-diphosphate synthase